MTLMWWGFYVDDRIPVNWVLTDRDSESIMLHPEMYATWRSSGGVDRICKLAKRPSGFHLVPIEALQADALADLLYQMERFGS